MTAILVTLALFILALIWVKSGSKPAAAPAPVTPTPKPNPGGGEVSEENPAVKGSAK